MPFDPAVLAAFAAASLALILTPGPDMTLTVGQTLAGGRRLGFAVLLGTSTGLFIHIALAVLGLSALLAASPAAFGALKLIGAAYLLFLAYKALRSGTAPDLGAAKGRRRSLREAYLLGVGVNLLNPKIVLFFLTFLPQFITAGGDEGARQLLTLGLTFQALSFPAGIALVLAAERFADALKRSKRAMRVMDVVFASVMAGFALKLLAASR